MRLKQTRKATQSKSFKATKNKQITWQGYFLPSSEIKTALPGYLEAVLKVFLDKKSSFLGLLKVFLM